MIFWKKGVNPGGIRRTFDFPMAAWLVSPCGEKPPTSSPAKAGQALSFPILYYYTTMIIFCVHHQIRQLSAFSNLLGYQYPWPCSHPAKEKVPPGILRK